ncbi:U2 snRNP-associated SURP motif-containing protein [Pleurostoma richardsiae]|uniref:U2 snRNP-associated SURP motif-containing protein n=1 Tax=Pleurostoma richardsiae TaxID=41990 RepID=A0AA38VUA8_9PEZI|nr:U2 snRNP-associated SURP motif-containing protein [Pleurostoma richardsiae]
MSSAKKIAEFPDVEAKLQKPTKKSIFEKQKAEAEAKRQREAAETAAVYADFVKSFDNDDDDDHGVFGGRAGTRQYRDDPPSRPSLGGQPPFSTGGSTGRRHFGLASQSGLKSGPGSLGPPPTSFNRKRGLDDSQADRRRERGDARGVLSFDDRDTRSGPLSKAFDASDDEDDRTPAGRAEEKAIARPTLRLANLPPGTSPAAVKALIPANLAVENVKISGPAGQVGTGTERKAMTAIVTLSQETAATEIDAAVSALQNRYLGFGFYLSLHRHLSSAAISSSSLPSIISTSSASQPFGAKPVAQVPGPQSHHLSGRFAPPTSYAPTTGGPLNRSSLFHVPIEPPKDIKQLRMIHKVVESVLEHGPEFEALLMSRPDVQREEKWAWIWDARSPGGIWYRWRLWEIMTGSQSRRGRGRYLPLFEDSHAWKVPDQSLAYEYTTGVDEFISESEYNSSDDEDFDEEHKQGESGPGGQDQEDIFLNPIDKSKLVHLLARLPVTMTKLRKGDVARVTAFAITHASRGADEVVDLIISNIEKPFAYSSANPDYKQAGKDKDDQDGDSRNSSLAPEEKAANGGPDTSSAKLLGLYVVSDILSSSSTSGIRHAWRYRQLFEAALRSRKVFEGLGMMAEKMSWGRLRAEKWKRSVGLVLNLWEGWCVFPADTQEYFVRSFETAASLKKEEKAEDGSKKEAGKWKTMEAAAVESAQQSGFKPVSSEPAARLPESARADTDESYDEYSDDEEADDDLLAEFDIDGESVLDIDIDGLTVEEDAEMGGVNETDAPAGDKAETKSVGGLNVAPSSAGIQSRKRMRAADMFADSDSGGES